MQREDQYFLGKDARFPWPPGADLSSKPAYLDIADIIRSEIRKRKLKAGDRLPAERDLVDYFGVARMTVRHALDVLQLEGLIDRRRGRHGGTFVRAEPPSVDLLKLGANAAELRRRGYKVRVTPLENRMEPPTEEIAELFGGVDYVHHVCQELALDEVSAAVVRTYCRVDHLPTLSEDAVEETVGNLLAGTVSRTEDDISLSVPSAEERELLGIPTNVPLLRVQRIGFNSDGEPVYCMNTVLRSDILTLRVTDENHSGGGGWTQNSS